MAAACLYNPHRGLDRQEWQIARVDPSKGLTARPGWQAACLARSAA
jgi:hypothetical protein